MGVSSAEILRIVAIAVLFVVAGLPSALTLAGCAPLVRRALLPFAFFHGVWFLVVLATCASYWGVPVARSWGWILAAVVAQYVVVLARARWRALLALGVRREWRRDCVLHLAALATILTLCWPLVVHGNRRAFGYANPDAANYVVLAQVLLERSRDDRLFTETAQVTRQRRPWDFVPSPPGENLDVLALWVASGGGRLVGLLAARVGQSALLALMTPYLGYRDAFFAYGDLAAALLLLHPLALLILARALGLSRGGQWASALLGAASSAAIFTYYVQAFSQQLAVPAVVLGVAIVLGARWLPARSPVYLGPLASLVIPVGLVVFCYPEVLVLLFLLTSGVVVVPWVWARGREPRRHARLLGGVLLWLLAGLALHALLAGPGSQITVEFLEAQAEGASRPRFRSGEGVWTYLMSPPRLISTFLGLTSVPAAGMASDRSVYAAATATLVMLGYVVLRLKSASSRVRTVAVVTLSTFGALCLKFSLDQYPYALGKLSLYYAPLLLGTIAGVVFTQRNALVRKVAIGALAVVLALNAYQGLTLARLSFPAVAGSQAMLPDFDGRFDPSTIREIYSLPDVVRTGVMIDVSHWQRGMWLAYWLRSLKPSVWRAQSYQVAMGWKAGWPGTPGYLLRNRYREGYVLVDERVDVITHPRRPDAIWQRGPYRLLPLQDFIDFEHGDLDYETPRALSPPRGAAGRDVFRAARLVYVRPRCTRCSLRLRVDAGPTTRRFEVRVNNRPLEVLSARGRSLLVSAPFGLDRDGPNRVAIHLLDPENGPVRLSAIGVYETGHELDDVPRSIDLQRQAFPFGIDGLWPDLWLDETASLSFPVLGASDGVRLHLEVPATPTPVGRVVEVRTGGRLLFTRVLVSGRNAVEVPYPPGAPAGLLVTYELRLPVGIRSENPAEGRTLRARLMAVESIERGGGRR